jgi:hypothetical protein
LSNSATNNVVSFVDLFTARPVVSRVKQLRLQRNDFETLKIIGRGAFGEVSVQTAACRLASLAFWLDWDRMELRGSELTGACWSVGYLPTEKTSSGGDQQLTT